MLKADHGLAHGAAHRVSLLARQRHCTGAAVSPDPADALYAGAKAGLRPLHDALLGEIRALGAFEIAPKKGYLSLRRRKQFAMIQPSTSTRIDLGVTLAAAVAAAVALSGCGVRSPAPAVPPSPVPAAAAATGQPAPGHRAHHDRATVAHGAGHHHSIAGGLLAVHDPGQVTGTVTGPCRTRDHGLLPDRSCTPGAIDPAVTQATIGSTICRAGYTDSVRPPESQTEAFKWDVAVPAYGQHDVPGELDHLVPLELGGDNDAANLWVEVGPIPNPKDAVEYALNQQVCDGRISLRAAQREIARNWLTAAAALGISVPAAGNEPSPGRRPSPTPGGSAWCTATASYSTQYGDWNVYVHSNQPDTTVTASGGGYSHRWHTNSSGYADVYLRGPSSGQTITVAVGSATCSTTAA
jgi:hypothetical protein